MRVNAMACMLHGSNRARTMAPPSITGEVTWPTITAYKLIRVRRNQTLGPLFINRRQVIPIGVWLPAEIHATQGFALRPGWHASHAPCAPHLSPKGRQWYQVEIAMYDVLNRPARQGGVWYIAQWMRVIKPVEGG